MSIQSIWKFPLIKMDDDITLQMPKGAEILHVDVQFGQPCLWALVEVTTPMMPRYFKLRGTGHEVGSDCGKHVGSFMLAGGNLVFHLFEATTNNPYGEGDPAETDGT